MHLFLLDYMKNKCFISCYFSSQDVRIAKILIET